MASLLEYRIGVRRAFPDVFTPAACAALEAVAPLESERRAVMAARLKRRAERIREKRRIDFLPADATIARTRIAVTDARDGHFEGGAIPRDLQRQWIQGTGPAARPRATTAEGLRSVAYALLSGADGWMFDGEDALGQVATMSLENQRHLRLAIARDPVFLQVAESVAAEMNGWARGFLKRELVADWRAQLDFTTKIFRPRGLHLDDRHVRRAGGSGLAASLVDVVLYLVHNHERLAAAGSSLVLYLPKIQTAEEAALWDELLAAAERALGLPEASVRVYVLIEQVEACFQLMEIRAALGRRFVGFNTGRWDYIHSVSDALSWDRAFVNPDVESLTMTFGYMRAYEDRVRRAVNTPDRAGQCALWQGGMEPNIPVGSPSGVAAGMARAIAGGEREQREGASGKWVAHWKMVPIVRPVWERAGADNQLGRAFPRLTYEASDADDLFRIDAAPRTVRGARALVSVGLQYGNAFGRGFQAVALKPADSFGDDDVLYLMEDMATGEIRLGILWEWLQKGATFTADDAAAGVKRGDPFTRALFLRLVDEEFAKLLRARDRDVHDDSKATTLPIARAALEAYVAGTEADAVGGATLEKPPWYVDLLQLTLDRPDLAVARRRIALALEAFRREGVRHTENPEFAPEPE
jgi:malate synthase